MLITLLSAILIPVKGKAEEIVMAREIGTRCIHLEEEELNHYGAISFPIYQTATFAHPGAGQSTGYH